jgi:hypothetical protein
MLRVTIKIFSLTTCQRFLIALLFVSGAPAIAATITVTPQTGDKPAVVAVQGDLRDEDIDDFRFKVAKFSTAVVALDSDGGSLLAGIRIGEIIRLKGFVTMVANGARCASACATAWLGGVRRFMGEQALIGFHAAYRKEPTGTSESGMGNAVLGAYLNSIGLSEAAVAYVTMAAPKSMTWLTLEEAAKYGIDVRPLSTAALPPQPRRATTATTTTTIPVDTHGLLGTWSCSGISTQWAEGYNSIQAGVNRTIYIKKFDGRYYWAEGEIYFRVAGNAPILNDTKQIYKAKFWFDGDKLYGREYWSSDPAKSQILDALTAQLFTLKENVMVTDHVIHISFQGLERTHRNSERCAK